MSILSFFEQWTENFWFLSTKFQQSCPNCNPRVHGNSLRKFISYESLFKISFNFRDWVEIILTSAELPKLVFLVRGKIPEKAVFPESSFLLSLSDNRLKFLWILSSNFPRGWRKGIVRVRRINFRKKFSFKKVSFYHSWTLSQNFSAFCHQSFEGVVKTAFRVFIENF